MVLEVEDAVRFAVSAMRKVSLVIFFFLIALFSVSCGEEVEHTAPAVYERDSLPDMVSYGVNNLISDSGVIKYRIVTEEWQLYSTSGNPRSVFPKGVLLTQFDESFHINSYIQCDSAWHFDNLHLWKLRGRVRIHTKTGLSFSSEELFWDESKHELYSYTFSRLVTPERTLQGSYFRSDERMTKYVVTNTRGSFEQNDLGGGNDSLASAPDTTKAKLRQQTVPQRRTGGIPLTH